MARALLPYKAIIALSLADPQLTNLVKSFQDQLARRIPDLTVEWVLPLTEEEQLQELLKKLGVDSTTEPESPWAPGGTIGGNQATRVSRGVVEFARLRGIHPITQDLTIEFARSSVHNWRAFGRNSTRYQVLTAHSAKNREFDHVFVFWTFKGESWSPSLRRRLLYNAITRAKLDCTVLVLGDKKRTETDPAISLLGPAMPAIDPGWKMKKVKANRPGPASS
jgi:superfamily I DNA/RNA helicase